MRISDWSSDVCSSDLSKVGGSTSRQESRRSAPSWRGFRSRRSGRRRSCGGVREMAQIKIKQVGSPIHRPESQRKVMIGLGPNKMHRVVEHEETPAIRWMTTPVHHMVEEGGKGDVPTWQRKKKT